MVEQEKTVTNKKELDVDFIGGQESLTKEKEKRISEYFKKIGTKNQGNTKT